MTPRSGQPNRKNAARAPASGGGAAAAIAAVELYSQTETSLVHVVMALVGGFIGAVFRATAKHVAPPSGVPSPLQWGDEATVRDRLGAHVKHLQVTRRLAQLEFPFSVPETVDFYRVHYGPILKAFAGLSETAQAALRRLKRSGLQGAVGV